MTCTQPDCDRPPRARGLCKNHYQQAWKRAQRRPTPTAPRRKKRPTCEHLGCRRSAVMRFTLPYPITRQEIACRAHAEHLLGSFVPGITVEDL